MLGSKSEHVYFPKLLGKSVIQYGAKVLFGGREHARV